MVWIKWYGRQVKVRSDKSDSTPPNTLMIQYFDNNYCKLKYDIILTVHTDLSGFCNQANFFCWIQITNSGGEVVITNDGATILKQMEVTHPAAKMVSKIESLLIDRVSQSACCSWLIWLTLKTLKLETALLPLLSWPDLSWTLARPCWRKTFTPLSSPTVFTEHLNS